MFWIFFLRKLFFLENTVTGVSHFIEEESKMAGATLIKATWHKYNTTRIKTQPTTTERQELALHGLLPRMARRQHTERPTPNPDWHKSRHRPPAMNGRTKPNGGRCRPRIVRNVVHYTPRAHALSGSHTGSNWCTEDTTNNLSTASKDGTTPPLPNPEMDLGFSSVLKMGKHGQGHDDTSKKVTRPTDNYRKLVYVRF
jgi:hypothetical protein